MDKKATWNTVIIIIVAVVSGIVILLVITNMIGAIQVSFHDSLCKFNLFIRHLALGNPIAVLGSQLAGTFGIIPPSIPIPCTTNKWQTANKETDFISNNTEVLKLFAEEIKRCWDIFGMGAWNSMIFAPSNVFSCFEDTVRFNITGSITQNDLKEYMNAQEILTIGKVHKSYLQFIPWDNIVIMKETAERSLYLEQTESGFPKEYFVSVYFADYFKVGLGFISLKGSGDVVSTACGTFRLSEKAVDTIIFCIR